MPITFIDIEQQKNRLISLLFIVLLLTYFLTALMLYLSFKFIFGIFLLGEGGLISRMDLIRVFSISAVIAAIHFYFSAFGAARSIMRQLGGARPDPRDGIHKRFLNIMDEIHVATGNRRKIEGLVIPSLSMNALAVADLRGDAIIGITEGLLARLTRPQLETVVAHEAYHILSGDCVEATVTVGLFGMYASALEKARHLGDQRYPGLHPVFWLFWVMVKLGELLSLVISREREYRADAGAVKMTRNPLAMAEALELIGRNWSGGGVIGSGIEMLCIAGPEAADAEVEEGWWSGLSSTHPPLRKRIDILLRMAHVRQTGGGRRAQASERQGGTGTGGYYLMNAEQQWEGPFTTAELGLVPWLAPLTWVCAGLDQKPVRAAEVPLLGQILSSGRPQAGGGAVSELTCPSCRQALHEVPYEQTTVRRCAFCGGVLVDNDKIPRIIARRDVECDERVRTLASAVISDNQQIISKKKLQGSRWAQRTGHSCPKCGNSMFRTFYSLAYLIEIDRCGICGLTWFDKDELEMLQCIIENRITARIEVESQG